MNVFKSHILLVYWHRSQVKETISLFIGEFLTIGVIFIAESVSKLSGLNLDNYFIQSN